YISPRTEKEAQICTLWQEVLDVEKIGVHSDFFENGGDSLLLIRLVSLINITFECHLSVRDCFVHRTVEQMADLISRSQGDFKYKDYLITGCDESKLYDKFPL
ncbi:phosphopantetheine-binding protein, partial [uncultured Shewanella sp.]|uniref:phosphopantetheine-binding protein n=1 Tax=uncultured Shewanella sp. TaxID=173975 RepID=UPI00262D6758